MHVRVIGHREARLHGAEIMPGLDLCRAQSHRHAAVNAVEGDLLDVHRDVMQAVIEKRAPTIDGHHSRVCHQLEVLQLHHQG